MTELPSVQQRDHVAEVTENRNLRAERDEAYLLITYMGNAVADMFEQMVRGKWVDDMGHRVEMNQQMLDLKKELIRAYEFREKIIKAREDEEKTDA